MRARCPALILILAVGLFALPDTAHAGRRRPFVHEAVGSQTFASPQVNPIVACPQRNEVYVAATTTGRVDVIDTNTNTVIGSVTVGMEPAALAIRPGGASCGNELWVSNHVSDSVSVIDIDPSSAGHLQVIETVQSVDPTTLVTSFDEPTGIAFKADGSEAYVALSTLNSIAVVDTSTYSVTQTLPVNGQDPHAVVVRNGRLYVAAFESDNQTELSSCPSTDGTDQCTLDAADAQAFATDPNLPNETVNIVVDPDRPDRDLFIWDTSNLGAGPTVVTGLGTLLYGMAIDSNEMVFITQADARNAVNGLNADQLDDLENRMFFNRVAQVDCSGGTCGAPVQHELDAAVGVNPTPGTQLATPYGVALSGDESVLVATAAGSSRIFTLSTATGSILDRQDVGEIPFGLALVSSDDTGTVYVLNTLDNTVSVVPLTAGGALGAPTASIPVGDDPTPDAVRLGRIALNDADASDQGTFSCGSCHPFGHVDQLIWRIGGRLTPTGHDEPRTTMPLRGLRDTIPLHWDGVLGDPFGGPNGAGGTGTTCSLAGGDHACFRDLADAALSGVMCDQSGSCPDGGNQLSVAERDNMAVALKSITYPPARLRRGDDDVSAGALTGFSEFFEDQGGIGTFIGITTCADSTAGCHELPLGIATNSQTVGNFDAPTMRGLNDRFVQFSNGITGSEENVQDATSWTPAQAMDELLVFEASFGLFQLVYGNVTAQNIMQMVEEASTGHSGAVGRQVMLNSTTTAACPACDAETILAALEAADTRGVINLRGRGVSSGGSPLEVSFSGGTYRVNSIAMSRSDLIEDAQFGQVLVALTGQLRSTVTSETAQPLIAMQDASCAAASGQIDPVLPSGSPFTLEAKYVAAGDAIFVDGQRLVATVAAAGGTPGCSDAVADTHISVDVSELGLSTGLHLLQVQNASGLLSDELPFRP